jgi:AcrR family transcriptional regulator
MPPRRRTTPITRLASAPTQTAALRPPTGGARERLLRAADDLFYHRGVRSVGIDEIIAVAGVAKASLYKHFDSKDALVAEYLRLRNERWLAWFTGAVAQHADAPRERLLAVFDVLGEWFQGEDFRGCAFQNAAVELADRAHAGYSVVLANRRAVGAYLKDLATKAGFDDPRSVSEQLAVLAEGAIITALLDGSEKSARVAREAAETILQTA